MFNYNAHKEKQRLEKKIRGVGGPLWYASQTIKGLGKTLIAIYALNAGVQTMMMLQSDAYKSREAIARNAYVIMKDLKEDPVFAPGVESYLQAKALVKPELRTTVNELEKNIEMAAQTQDEFVSRIQKIYNPLEVLRLN